MIKHDTEAGSVCLCVKFLARPVLKWNQKCRQLQEKRENEKWGLSKGLWSNQEKWCVKAIPYSRGGKEGLAACIESLLKAGFLKPGISPYNIPILPVKKLDGWTPKRKQNFQMLKSRLTENTPLALQDREKEFELYVNVKQGHAEGILVQKCLTQGPEWPHCLQNCAAKNLM